MSIEIIDDLVPLDLQTEIDKYLRGPGWVYGWKSDPEKDKYSFWHKHLAGHELPDHTDPNEQYVCEDGLKATSEIIYKLWCLLKAGPLKGHTLLRCYANGYPYGADGSVHTDTVSHNGYTTIFYPHKYYDMNWAGETVFLTDDQKDIRLAVCPKPGRIVIFDGTIPHVGRGLSRSCPHMRVTLMFKTQTQGELITDPHVNFLKSLGADKISHSGRTLLTHLIGTRNLLRRWKASIDVQNAGLFHSIYGTAWFKQSLRSFSDRDEIRNLIGDKAEELAYLFCATDRKFHDYQVTLLTNQSEVISLSDQQVHDLMEIEAANLIDQGYSPVKPIVI